MIAWLLCALFARCEVEAAPAPVAAPPAVERTMAVAVPLVAKWEGLKTTAYLDRIASPPVWTICYGETEGVRPGETRTVAECEEGLRRGLVRYRTGLHRHFQPETVQRRLTPERDAAFVSLAWNVGIAGAGGSTATRRLNGGDIRGACEALTWWNRAGKRVVRGLVNRRADEHRLCLQGLA
jgi:lysozyme